MITPSRSTTSAVVLAVRAAEGAPRRRANA
eukprot:COSAG01_NODE_46550_length_399_cov_0.846667_2_plen_29_part_01